MISNEYTASGKRSLPARLKEFLILLKDAFLQWNDREPFANSSVIAYYTIFSLPGLLVIVINIAGYFYGKEAITTQLTAQIQSITGGDTAKDIESIISKANESKGTVLASILGIITLLFGATGVFYQLQQILNKLWEVKPNPRQKILKILRDRLFSFGLILAVGFLLLVSLVLTAGLTAVSDWVSAHLSDALKNVFKIVDFLFSLGIITLLFASIYKFLPDAKVRWRDVWPGALLTSLLFVIAKFGLGIYFGNSDPSSTYGAAGSIILIMLWVSYSGLIVLFGAEFTSVYASRYGKKILPSEGAISTEGQNDNGALINKKKESDTKIKNTVTDS